MLLDIQDNIFTFMLISFPIVTPVQASNVLIVSLNTTNGANRDHNVTCVMCMCFTEEQLCWTEDSEVN
jgi:hypothetical protein